MSGEDNIGSDAVLEGVNVESLERAGAGVKRELRLLNRHALDLPALLGEILGQKRSGDTLVVGSGFNVDEPAGKVYRVDRHATDRIPCRSGLVGRSGVGALSGYTGSVSEAVSQIRTLEDLRGPAGRLEALLNSGQPNAEFTALICHPHPAGGGTMHNKVVYNAMKVFSSLGLPVLRFNFRSVGKSEGEHSHGEGEQEDVLAALGWLGREFGLPTLVAGFSFGAAVSLRACCSDERVPGLVALGLPVEAAGRDYSYSFLAHCTTPKLFLSGDSDQYAPRPKLETVFASAAEPKRVVFVPGAEHFFQGTETSPGPKLDQMRAALDTWLRDTFGL